jgi:tetratricopeptide (TPR) repeat protein
LIFLERAEMAELDDDTYSQIMLLAEGGDDCLKDSLFDEALTKYQEALSLLPDPYFEWDLATSILAGIGDAYYFAGDYERALRAFQDALLCPDALENPFFHLRIGEIHYEYGDRARAKDELAKAYMLAGDDIFLKEDPKYLALLRDTLLPPPGKDTL